MYEMIPSAISLSQKLNHALNKRMRSSYINAEIVAGIAIMVSIRHFEEHSGCKRDHGVEVVRHPEYAAPDIGVVEEKFEDCGCV